MRHRPPRLALVLGLALLLSACGGGGGAALPSGPGTPGPTPDVFLGTYGWHSWQGVAPGPHAIAEWGTASADGLGSLSGTFTENDGGVLSGPMPLTQGTYVLGADNRLTLDGAGGLVGGIAADGSALLLGVGAPGNHPGIAVLIQQQGTWSDADLLGDYHLCGFSSDVVNDIALFDGTTTFDGAGLVTGLRLGQNRNGSITPPSAPFAGGTYAVAADGTVTWDTGAEVMQGTIGGGGEIIVFSGSTAADNKIHLLVMIKEASAATNAAFSGAYHAGLLFVWPTPPPRYSSMSATVTADGAGSFHTDSGATTNTDGTVGVTSGAGSDTTYAVAADGALSIFGGAYLGAVSASGRYAVVAGGTAASTAPYFQVFIR